MYCKSCPVNKACKYSYFLTRSFKVLLHLFLTKKNLFKTKNNIIPTTTTAPITEIIIIKSVLTASNILKPSKISI